MTSSATASSRPRVLILSFTEVARDPRPLKQLQALKERYDVSVAAYGESPDPDVEFIRLDRTRPSQGLARLPGIFTALMLFRMYRLHEHLDARNREPLEHLAGREWDLILAHDPGSLAVAQQLPSRRGILLDLHEYSPAMVESSFKWSLLYAPYYRWLCRVRVPKVAAITTVAQGIAEKYRVEFGFDATVVVNATPFHELQPSRPAESIRLVHSGVAAPDRRLEHLVAAVRDSQAAVTLDFFLLDTFAGYLDQLRDTAAGDPRVRFHDPVPYSELVTTLNQFDLGIHVIAPTSFNNYSALPNKFFDFIQARLGVVIGPSPEMARYVQKYELGAIAESFMAESLIAVLESLTPEKVSLWKAHSHAAAEELAGEHQANIWADMAAALLA